MFAGLSNLNFRFQFNTKKNNNNQCSLVRPHKRNAIFQFTLRKYTNYENNNNNDNNDNLNFLKKPPKKNKIRRVVVTGMGVVSPLSHEIDEFWEKLVSGKSGITTLTAEKHQSYFPNFPVEKLPNRIFAPLSPFTTEDERILSSPVSFLFFFFLNHQSLHPINRIKNENYVVE